MIYDNLKNIKDYTLKGNFEKAINFIEQTNLNSLELGKSEIDGKNVYVAVSEYQTKNEIGKFEVHENYADIQIILSGNERIDWAERKDCEISSEYNQEKDVLFLDNAVNSTEIHIKEGQFAIFFPQDAHRPNMTDKIQTKVKKAVVKVKIK